ncbi:MAG: ADP-glyceromanno-heptose 6-epimerase [Desulfovibrionaceae bacterium]|nr:ADP-glyceromanno-heptose 6-epimerase [Desulfovibrionaceae bacterium]MBF0513853.1 ADP-glyceromanno-heptose 6-epimerase [Desulfovibrionaceae bacterium]
MYIVTGGAGFIGSGVVHHLNRLGVDDILIVDHLDGGEKWKNLRGLRFADYLDRAQFLELAQACRDRFAAKAVIHLGACSATTEFDAAYLMENNTRYSQIVCRYCLANSVRCINASSAATYGDGALGFDDDPAGLDRLRPLNPYGYSKHLFDLWAAREGLLTRFASLKFFNVFGPNEYHKGDMKSVVCKAYEQIKATGTLRLFKSYRDGCPDGGQMRDFVYLKDCLEAISWLLEHPDANGLFNLGTGRARSFNDLARAVFAAMGAPYSVEYIDMPHAIRDKYQYFTQAKMDRLRASGYAAPFTPLEDAVADYVKNYLAAPSPYLADGADGA